MLKYAVLDATDKVIGVSTLSGPVELDNHILLAPESEIQTGDLYDRVSAGFSRPAPVPPPAPPKISEALLPRKITVNAFRSRFTSAEELAFETALATSPMLSLLDKRLAALVATHVDLDDARYTTEAMPALMGAGILSAERAEQIMTAATQWHELPPAIQQQYIAAGYEIDV